MQGESMVAQSLGGSTDFPHLQQFNPDKRTLTWERLENKRLNKLGLGAKRYSRHFQRFQKSASMSGESSNQPILKADKNGVVSAYILVDGEMKKMNSIAPFYTEEKPTCGFFFSRVTDNKKKKFGIPPSDLVKWRSTHQ